MGHNTAATIIGIMIALGLATINTGFSVNPVLGQSSDPGSIGDKFQGDTFGEKVSEDPARPALPAQIEPGCLGGEASDQASDFSSNNSHCPLEP